MEDESTVITNEASITNSVSYSLQGKSHLHIQTDAHIVGALLRPMQYLAKRVSMK